MTRLDQWIQNGHIGGFIPVQASQQSINKHGKRKIQCGRYRDFKQIDQEINGADVHRLVTTKLDHKFWEHIPERNHT